MKLTATRLRSQIYRVLDRVAQTGEPVEIVRKGKTLRIVVDEPAPRRLRLRKLVPHPEAFRGDLDDIVHVDWSSEWRPGD